MELIVVCGVIAVALFVLMPYLCLRCMGASHRGSVRLIWGIIKDVHGAFAHSDDDIIAEIRDQHRR